MDKIVFEVSQEDRVFIENECEKTLLTFNSFIQRLLDEYRGRQPAKTEPRQPEAPTQTETTANAAKKHTVRKNEKNTSEAQV